MNSTHQRLDIVVQRVASFRIDPMALRRPGHRLILLTTPSRRVYLDRTGARDAFDETITVPDNFDAAVLSDAVRTVIGATPTSQVTLLCHDEYALYAAAGAREAVGLAGPRPADVECFVDKAKMKQKLRAAGIRVPRYEIFDPARYGGEGQAYLAEIADAVGLPVFVKPTGESGAVGAERIESVAALHVWAAQIGPDGATGNTTEFEIDEFVDGTLYHVDTLVSDGQILAVHVNRYLHPLAQYADGLVCSSYTVDEEEPIVRVLKEYNATVLDAFDAKPTSGAFHHEVFITNEGEPIFLEIAARAPAALAPQTGRIRWGVDVEEAHFRLQLGDRDRDIERGSLGPFAGFIYYPKSAGEVVDVVGPPPVESSLLWMPNVRVGEVVSASADVRDFAGAVLIWNTDYAGLKADMARLAQHQPVRFGHSITYIA